MRAASLRHLTRLGRRSLHQSSRCEDTSVSAVNAWLAAPPSKPTWTIAGACAAHDVACTGVGTWSFASTESGRRKPELSTSGHVTIDPTLCTPVHERLRQIILELL